MTKNLTMAFACDYILDNYNDYDYELYNNFVL